jgi:hypothetical protein
MARTEEMKWCIRVYVAKIERKRPRGRTRCRWEDNIKNEKKK